MKTQLKRGPTSEHETFLEQSGVITLDDDKRRLHYHDGVTPGGIPTDGISGALKDGNIYAMRDEWWETLPSVTPAPDDKTYDHYQRTMSAGEVLTAYLSGVNTTHSNKIFALKRITAGVLNVNLAILNSANQAGYQTTSGWLWDDSLGLDALREYNTVLNGSFGEVGLGLEGTAMAFEGIGSYVSTLDPHPTRGPLYYAVEIMADYTHANGTTITESSRYSSSYPGWKAFTRTDGSHTDSWVSSSSTPNNGNPAWIQVNLPYEVGVKSYAFTTRKDGSGNTSGQPKRWRLEGSMDGTNWNVLDDREETTQYPIGGTELYYTVTNPGVYKHIRMYITESYSSTFVGIGLLDILSPNIESGPFLFRAGDGSYYKGENGALVSVTTPTTGSDIEATGTLESGWLDIAALNSISPVTLVTASDLTVNGFLKLDTQGFITPTLDLLAYKDIQSLSFTVDGGLENYISVIVSPDGTNWYSYSGGWNLVTGADLTSAGLAKIVAEGMTHANLASLTWNEWSGLYTTTPDGSPDTLQLMVAVSTVDPTLGRKLTTLDGTHEDKGRWAITEDVVISRRSIGITIAVNTAGEYRFNVQA